MAEIITDISNVTEDLYNNICKTLSKCLNELLLEIEVGEFNVSTDVLLNIAGRLLIENPECFYTTIENFRASYSSNFYKETGIKWAKKFKVSYLYTNEQIISMKQELSNFNNEILSKFENINSNLEKILFSIYYFKNNNFTITDSVTSNVNIYDILTAKEVSLNYIYVLTSYLLKLFQIKFYICIYNYETGTSIGLKVFHNDNYYNIVFNITDADLNNINQYSLKSDSYMLNHCTSIEIYNKFDFDVAECLDDKYDWLVN